MGGPLRAIEGRTSMWWIHRITGAWFGVRAGRVSRARPSRRRRSLGWGGDVLEVRALLSTYLVIGTGDAGVGVGFKGDLRYAIEKADRDTGNSTIVFAPILLGKTIALNTGTLEIDKPSGTLTIRGPGAGELAISGGQETQVFDVAPSTRATISGLTITGGLGTEGGGVYNDGSLTLVDCTVSGNTDLGGGGGGVANGFLGVMTILDSTISGNVTKGADGGGIANAGIATIIRSTITGNASRGGSGGGVANAGIMTIGDSTVSGNRALFRDGGGIANTFALTMLDDTVSGNTAGIEGGGVDNEAILGATTTMDNTIVSGNVSKLDASTGDVFDNSDAGGTQMVGGYDLIGVGDMGGLTDTHVGVDPRLGPLQNNGGPTWTQALLAGSPAIKAGDTSLVPTWMTTDQRGGGYARFAQGNVDLGAFEVQAPRWPIVFSPAPIPRSTLPTEAIIGLTIIPPSSTGIVGQSHIRTAGTATSGA
jgi:hypothetical protein